MPKLWQDTIETHRAAVRAAIIDATVRLVSTKGLRAVTMSEVAGAAGVGRATLYKYFPDLESILSEWHEQQIDGHLKHLERIAAGQGTSLDRLHLMLERFAKDASEGGHHPELERALHHQRPVAEARERVESLLQKLIAEGVHNGEVRSDLDPAVLASFCLHAVSSGPHRRDYSGYVQLVLDALNPIYPRNRTHES